MRYLQVQQFRIHVYQCQMCVDKFQNYVMHMFSNSPRCQRRESVYYIFVVDNPAHIICLMACIVRQRYAVEAAHLSHPWFPETKTVDDQEFVRLNEWDRGLVRFATEKSLDFRKETKNIGLIDELCSRRNAACDQKYREICLPEDEENPEERRSNRKGRRYIRKAKASDLAFLPNKVSIRLPDATSEDGPSLEGFECYLLSEGIRTSNVYIELTSRNLDYIRSYVSLTGSQGRRWKKRGRDVSMDKGLDSPSDGDNVQDIHTSD